MPWLVAAWLVVVIHFAFIAFALFGALLFNAWPWLVWLHLPVVTWGVLVVVMSWTCPLTPLENRLRQAAGQAGYNGGFMERYLFAGLCPQGLSPRQQTGLGIFLLLLNTGAYGWFLWERLT